MKFYSNVKIIFDFEKNPEKHRKITELDIEETKKKISSVQGNLSVKLPQCLEFLDQQEAKENYIEVNLPIFQYGLTIMMSKIRKKFLISVMDQRNSQVYGNLLLDGYDCIDVNELRKLGKWSTWRPSGVSVFKLDQ